MKPIFALVILVALVWVAACGPKPASPSGTTIQGTGAQITDYESFKPDSLGLTKGMLNMQGMKVKVDLVKKQQGKILAIDLVAFGTVFETEKYLSTDQEFSVSSVAGEVYDPPIPLIRYGMHVGDGWDWKGQIQAGIIHRATAKITTSNESLVIRGVSYRDVIRVDVVLHIDSGLPSPVERKLAFWLAKDMGVVKRIFGSSSVREPAED